MYSEILFTLVQSLQARSAIALALMEKSIPERLRWNWDSWPLGPGPWARLSVRISQADTAAGVTDATGIGRKVQLVQYKYSKVKE
jgi:hypothetical protein